MLKYIKRAEKALKVFHNARNDLLAAVQKLEKEENLFHDARHRIDSKLTDLSGAKKHLNGVIDKLSGFLNEPH